MEPVLRQVLERYPKEVKLVHKFLPHKGELSRKAAVAALAAGRQGKFWEYQDRVFENQDGLDEAKLVEIAAGLKLDLEAFGKARADPAFEAVVDTDLADAQALGVAYTPWVYVNGRHLEDRSPAGFAAAIAKELKK